MVHGASLMQDARCNQPLCNQPLCNQPLCKMQSALMQSALMQSALMSEMHPIPFHSPLHLLSNRRFDCKGMKWCGGRQIKDLKEAKRHWALPTKWCGGMGFFTPHDISLQLFSMQSNLRLESRVQGPYLIRFANETQFYAPVVHNLISPKDSTTFFLIHMQFHPSLCNISTPFHFYSVLSQIEDLR